MMRMQLNQGMEKWSRMEVTTDDERDGQTGEPD